MKRCSLLLMMLFFALSPWVQSFEVSPHLIGAVEDNDIGKVPFWGQGMGYRVYGELSKSVLYAYPISSKEELQALLNSLKRDARVALVKRESAFLFKNDTVRIYSVRGLRRTHPDKIMCDSLSL